MKRIQTYLFSFLALLRFSLLAEGLNYEFCRGVLKDGESAKQLAECWVHFKLNPSRGGKFWMLQYQLEKCQVEEAKNTLNELGDTPKVAPYRQLLAKLETIGPLLKKRPWKMDGPKVKSKKNIKRKYKNKDDEDVSFLVSLDYQHIWPDEWILLAEKLRPNCQRFPKSKNAKVQEAKVKERKTEIFLQKIDEKKKEIHLTPLKVKVKNVKEEITERETRLPFYLPETLSECEE